MLNRAFYGYDEFALFRSPSIVLIDLPSHDYTFHEGFAPRWICSEKSWNVNRRFYRSLHIDDASY